MAGVLPPTLPPPPSLLTFSDHTSYSRPLNSNSFAIFTARSRSLFRCPAKKKISFADQILDYIEGISISSYLFSPHSVLSNRFPGFCSIILQVIIFLVIQLYKNVSLCLGGPKLRRWYGAPDLLPKDGSAVDDEDEDEDSGNLIPQLTDVSILMSLFFFAPLLE